MSRVITTQGEWERIKICYLHHMIIMFIAWFISIVIAHSRPLAQWLEQATHNRLVAGSSPARATKSLFTYQEELRVQGVLDGGLYFMTNAISRKKCGGWFRMRAGVLVRGTPLQCIYPSVLIQKYLEKMPAMPSGQIAYMWN